MPNNQANSGSDLLPIIYTVTGVATTYFWEEPQRERMPEYFSHTVVTPSYQAYDVTGPSQEYAHQIAAGTATFKVVQSDIRIRGAAAYVPVIYNSVYYQIAVGQRVILPKIVMDIINESSTFAAIAVP